MDNGSMVMMVGTGAGRVTLTPQADGTLAYDYRFQGQTAAASLRRS